MRIVNADVFLTLLFWRGLIDEITCNEIKRAAYQSEITWNEDAKKVIKILEDDKKGLRLWNPEPALNYAIEAIKEATYYKELAQSYGQTIVKLNEALSNAHISVTDEEEIEQLSVPEQILVDTVKNYRGNKEMQGIALQTFIQTQGTVSNECKEIVLRYMD